MRGRQAELFEADDGLPEGLAYVEDFISPEEERALLGEIAALPLAPARYRGFVAKRRTLSYGADYDFGRNALRPAPPVPAFLAPLRARVAAWLGVPAEAFAHALLTDYAPGTCLGWHRDVPDFALVAGVSLGCACRMRFRPYPPTRDRSRHFALELAPRSAYAMQGVARWHWQHGIPATPGQRWSITFRTFSKRPRAAANDG